MGITRYISIEFQFPRFDWKFTEAEYVLTAKWGLNFYQIEFLYVRNLTEHGLWTSCEEIAFTSRPKINSHSQIFRYGRSIFCLPHQPKFSDFFELCLSTFGFLSPWPKAITCIFRRGVMSTLPNMYPIDGRRKELRKRRQT